MDKTIITIPGDLPGLSYSLTVLRFSGSDPAAPTAYLQAALHGNELPGVAALHVLISRLKAAEAEGVLRLKGFTAVPGKPMRLVVQGVGRRVGHHFDRAWGVSEPRDGRLTVIGLKGFDIKAVEAAGGRVIHAASLVDRSAGTADLGVPFTPLIRLAVPTYQPDNLPPELAAIPAIKPGSRAA